MSYCTIADVKIRLAIPTGELGYNDEITGLIEEADSIIDNELKKFTTVPLSSTPTFIKHLSADYAADLFRTRRLSPSERASVLKMAQEKLASYIEATYHSGAMEMV